MQAALYAFIALFMGVTLSVYLPMNGAIAKHVGSSITANLTFYFIGFIGTVIIFLAAGDRQTLGRLGEAPAHLYLTGFISAFVVLGTTYLIPRLGPRKLFILMVAGQILMAMAVSHFGALETPRDPITIKKCVGAALLLAGAVVSTS